MTIAMIVLSLGVVALGVGVFYALLSIKILVQETGDLQREIRWWRRAINTGRLLDSAGRALWYKDGMPFPPAPHGLPHLHAEEGLTAGGRITEGPHSVIAFGGGQHETKGRPLGGITPESLRAEAERQGTPSAQLVRDRMTPEGRIEESRYLRADDVP